MDHDGMRDYLSGEFGIVLLATLAAHSQRADEEVLRLSGAKQYDPMEVRFRAGVATGMGLMMDVIRQLKKGSE